MFEMVDLFPFGNAALEQLTDRCLKKIRPGVGIENLYKDYSVFNRRHCGGGGHLFFSASDLRIPYRNPPFRSLRLSAAGAARPERIECQPAGDWGVACDGVSDMDAAQAFRCLPSARHDLSHAAG